MNEAHIYLASDSPSFTPVHPCSPSDQGNRASGFTPLEGTRPSTAALGAALGAVPAGVDIKKPIGIFYFVALPVLCAGTGVAYFMLRSSPAVESSKIGSEILEDLPDPEKAR